MDTLNHFLIAFLLFGDWKLALVSCSPDIFIGLIKFGDIKSEGWGKVLNEENSKTKNLDNSRLFYAHKILHSVFVPITISLFSPLTGLAYGVHIVVDMFTHERDYYLLPFKKRVGGLLEWTLLKSKTKLGIALCFILLALIVSLLGGFWG